MSKNGSKIFHDHPPGKRAQWTGAVTPVVQTTGNSTTAVMSQDATTIELGKKLDKQSPLSADAAYIVKKDGSNGLIRIVGGTSDANTVVCRNASGQIIIADPTAYNHAASKQYVDNRTTGAYFCGSIWYPGNGAGTGVKISNVWIPFPPFRKDQTQNLQGHTIETGWDAGADCSVDYNIKYSIDILEAPEYSDYGVVQVTLNGTYYEVDFSTSEPIAHTLSNQTYNAVYLDNTTFEQTTGQPTGEGIFYYSQI